MTTKTFYLELHHIGEFEGPLRMSSILSLIPELGSRYAPDAIVNKITTEAQQHRIDFLEVVIPDVCPPGDLYICTLGADILNPKHIYHIQQMQINRLSVLGGTCLPLLRGQLGMQAGLKDCDITGYRNIFLRELTRTLH